VEEWVFARNPISVTTLEEAGKGGTR
jgi:hypothetical protein